jgi:hypothetical protein
MPEFNQGVANILRLKDLDKAKAFAASDELRKAMKKAGVGDSEYVFFLN